MAQRRNVTTRKNLFGFGRKPAPAKRTSRSGLTLAAASRMAKEAGYRGSVDFRDWLESKRLSDRSEGFISRVGQAYGDGAEQRERDLRAVAKRKSDAEQRKREERDAREDRRAELRDERERQAESRRQAQEDRKEAARTAKLEAQHEKRWKAGQRKRKESGGSSSFMSVPDEDTLQKGFARGLSISDMMRGNPHLRQLRKSNPAKFDRCVKEVQAKGGAKNVYAVCKSALKENAGRKRFWVVTPNGELLNTYATKKEAEQYVKNVKYASGITAEVKDSRRENPAAASAEVFEEFHGYPSEELVKVKWERHYHKHLAAAGDFAGFSVRPIDGGKIRRIDGMGDALICFNEEKDQLFVEGGDQGFSWAELQKFGIRDQHEIYTLGKLRAVGYFTDKTHLGDKGGEAVYSHIFRTTNKAGRHVIVKIAQEPDLIYRARDEKFEISGGSYLIRAEGIDK